MVDALVNLAVAPHGLTDLWERPPLVLAAAYAVAAAAAAVLPDRAVFAAFLAASASHIGAATAVVLAVAAVSTRAAKWALLAHMLGWHLPAHYAGVEMSAAAAVALLAFGAGLEAVGFRPLNHPRLTTALVGGHVIAGWG